MLTWFGIVLIVIWTVAFLLYAWGLVYYLRTPNRSKAETIKCVTGVIVPIIYIFLLLTVGANR